MGICDPQFIYLYAYGIFKSYAEGRKQHILDYMYIGNKWL